MRYFYHENAGDDLLQLSPANYAHAKARRVKVGDVVYFCALDGWLHEYEIIEFHKSAKAKWLSKQEFKATSSKKELALGLIEPSSINEIAPFLNELGLSRLHIVCCERSQNNFKFDEKKLAKLQTVLINSSQQCGRADTMALSFYKDLNELAKSVQKTIVLIDFSGEKIADFSDENSLYVIGPEGGFTPAELKKFAKCKLNANLVLKAKTAAVAISAAMLV